jgi:SAM-dependent methyltransferase
MGMSSKFSDDYHDYVFRDGKLVGDFDNMYRNSKLVPWEQDTRAEHWYTQVGIAMIREFAPYGQILEVGCGLGYIAAKLEESALLGVDAFDVSRVAIDRASDLHPGINFFVDNIADDTFRPKRAYDLVVVSEVFWYVTPWLDTTVRNIDACVKPGGFLYIGQAFPALHRVYVGKDRISGPDQLISYFPQYEPVYTARLRNHRLSDDGPILRFLGAKRS